MAGIQNELYNSEYYELVHNQVQKLSTFLLGEAPIGLYYDKCLVTLK